MDVCATNKLIGFSLASPLSDKIDFGLAMPVTVRSVCIVDSHSEYNSNHMQPVDS